jgi:hypothetical protein
MKADEIDVNKYTDESLEFILDQSEKLLKETFTSYRETINKSYIALGFYISIISFAINKVVNDNLSFIKLIPYLIIIAGIFNCIYIIWNNLFASEMKFIGSDPKCLINKFFEQFSEKKEQLRQYQLSKIADYNDGIEINKSQIDIRNDNFKWSVEALLISMVISFIFFLLCRA